MPSGRGIPSGGVAPPSNTFEYSRSSRLASRAPRSGIHSRYDKDSPLVEPVVRVTLSVPVPIERVPELRAHANPLFDGLRNLLRRGGDRFVARDIGCDVHRRAW